MADGFDIHVNEQLARRLKAAAEAAGVDPADYAHQLLDVAVDIDSVEDDRRWAEYERTGETVSLEDAIQSFDDAIARGRAKRAG